MKQTKQIIALCVATTMLMPSVGSAHSGGTDSNGCHAGSQPYHCHDSKSDELNVEAMAIGVLLLLAIRYFSSGSKDSEQSFVEDVNNESRKSYLLPKTEVDENLNPSVGLEWGLKF